MPDDLLLKKKKKKDATVTSSYYSSIWDQMELGLGRSPPERKEV